MTDDIQAQLENYLDQQDVESPDEADQPDQEVTPDATETEADEVEEEVTDETDDAPEKTDDEEAESDQDDQDLPDFLVIKHNGEEKKVSKKEAIELTQKGYDYDVKTARLAEERREFQDKTQRISEVNQEVETKRVKLVEELQIVEAFNSHPIYTEDQLKQILHTDGAEAYLKASKQEEKRQQVLNVVRSKLAQHQEEMTKAHEVKMQQIEEAERTELEAKMPELLTEEGGTRLVSYLTKTYGFTPEQIGSEKSHKLFIMAEKARRYDDLQAKGAERKPIAPLPKVTKQTKARQDGGQVDALKTRDYIDRARKTGKTEDAAAAIMRLMN